MRTYLRYIGMVVHFHLYPRNFRCSLVRMKFVMRAELPGRKRVEGKKTRKKEEVSETRE